VPGPVLDSVTFRAATLLDLYDLILLIEGAYRGDESRTGWTTEADLIDGQRTDDIEIREILDDSTSRLRVAEQITARDPGAARVVGSVLARREDDGVHLGMLAVHPELQNRGVGRLLLDEGERVAVEELGANECVLWVVSCRRELLAWYVRRGYRDSGLREPFPYDSPRLGRPRVAGLEFAVLRKRV
jgi:ribosomal protein S18 acetylase RimI-like enzyme